VTTLLRPVTDQDVPDVLTLAERNVEVTTEMDQGRLTLLRSLADRFDVVDVGGAFGGFVLTFGPGSSYDSQNYRWFADRFADFYYLDRIILHEGFRRRGLGGLVYDELEAVAAEHGRMALEVNLVPPNEPSLAFHRRRGYAEIGRLGDDQHRVVLMEKVLPPGTPPAPRAG
jgi:uncharacterized protein